MLKKMFMIILLLPLMLILPPMFCAADQPDDSRLEQYRYDIEQKLNSAIDSDTRETMSKNNVTGSDMTGVGADTVISAAVRELTEDIRQPVVVLARITALLILTAAARSLAPAGGLTSTFSLVSLMGCITIVYSSIYTSFSAVCEHLRRMNEFMIAYIPVYASVSAASGGIALGGSYYASSLWVCELIAFAADRLIMPFLSILLAVSFTAAINPDMRFSSAVESMKNAVRITLTALMTLFSGLVTVKGFAASAADNAAARAVRFGAVSFVPIIGGSVSEAYSTVSAGVGVIRTSVGTLGIAVLLFMLIRPLVMLITVKLTLECGKTVSDVLGITEISELLRSACYVMSAAVSTTLCFSIMFLISTAVMMPAAANIGQ